MSEIIKIEKHLNSEGDIISFISECETKMKNQLEKAALAVMAEKDENYVALSGPTCSGKTTTALKLIRDFNKSGRLIRHISIDDFFIDRTLLIENAEKNGEESPDFDSIKAIDLDYLSECVEGIIENKKVYLPIYSFIDGARIDYIPFEPHVGDIVVFEGIQAIYPEFTGLFKGHKLQSIHINVSTDLEYNGQYFKRREIRLMRRLVRDFRFRGAVPDLTFSMWKNVVKNEDINIMPYEKNSDIQINSLLPYEINMIKKPLIETLSHVNDDSVYYPRALEIIRKMEPFETIDEKYMPLDSLYHEFLG